MRRDVFAIEWNKHCQHELLVHPSCPSCFFGDLEEFLSPMLRSQIPELLRSQRLQPVLEPLIREHPSKAVTTFLSLHVMSSMSCRKYTVCHIAALLHWDCWICLTNPTVPAQQCRNVDLFNLRKAWCLTHHRQCSLRTACTHVAGTSCTDFSAIGKGEGEKGATYIHFLIWVAHRKSLQEPVVVQENVTNFPRDTLQRLLPEYEWTFGVVSPDCLGWPIRRDRQWCVHGAKSFSIRCLQVASPTQHQCVDDRIISAYAHACCCSCILHIMLHVVHVGIC